MTHAPQSSAELDGSPLAETLAASRAHFGGHDVLATRTLVPDGWRCARELAGPGPAIDDVLARATERSASGRPDIGGTLLAESYTFALTLRAVGTLLFGDRIPALAAETVWLNMLEDTTIVGVAFTGGAYGVAGDPRADDPGLTVFDGIDALLDRLHAELEQHLAPVLEAIAGATGRPLKALWRSAGDRLGGAFLWLGEVCTMRERAWELGTEAMREGRGPLAVGAGFRVLEHAGIAEPTRNRRSCCLIYRADGNDTCFTCPLTKEAQRLQRLAARATAA